MTVRPFRKDPNYVAPAPLVETASLDFKTPLDFVSEAPAVNRAGDGFVPHHNFPEYKELKYHKNTDVGYYTWEKAQALFTKTFLANYYIPSKEQWLSIVPTSGSSSVITIHDWNGTPSPKSDIKQTAQVGEEPAQEYVSDFFYKKEDGRNVTYAIRFKGTKWESAWRYTNSWVRPEHEDRKRNRLRIQCVPLQGKTGITLEGISNPKFFTDNPCTVRTFLAYDNLSSESSDYPHTYGDYGRYWSTTKLNDNSQEILRFSSASASFHYASKTECVPVRPFRKQP